MRLGWNNSNSRCNNSCHQCKLRWKPFWPYCRRRTSRLVLHNHLLLLVKLVASGLRGVLIWQGVAKHRPLYRMQSLLASLPFTNLPQARRLVHIYTWVDWINAPRVTCLKPLLEASRQNGTCIFLCAICAIYFNYLLHTFLKLTKSTTPMCTNTTNRHSLLSNSLRLNYYYCLWLYMTIIALTDLLFLLITITELLSLTN